MNLPRNDPSTEFVGAARGAGTPAVERREFLAGAVVTGTALAGSLAGDLAVAGEGDLSSTRRRPRILSDFECEDFQAMIGEEFTVSGQAGSRQEPLQLVVHDVESVRHTTDANRPGGLRPSGFIVQFAARSGRLGDEGIYRLHHQGLEVSPLFLQPSQKTVAAGEALYEAVFN